MSNDVQWGHPANFIARLLDQHVPRALTALSLRCHGPSRMSCEANAAAEGEIDGRTSHVFQVLHLQRLRCGKA
jgi:hypothetical protein